MVRNKISGNAGVGRGVFKNAAIFFTVILITFGCADSSAQTPNQDGSRLVGTWVKFDGPRAYGDDGSTWVFNADGTGSNGEGNFKYGAIAGKIVFDGGFREFVISNDGKTLIFGTSGSGGVVLKKSTGK